MSRRKRQRRDTPKTREELQAWIEEYGTAAGCGLDLDGIKQLFRSEYDPDDPDDPRLDEQ